jgi:hypothetical protein
LTLVVDGYEVTELNRGDAGAAPVITHVTVPTRMVIEVELRGRVGE